MGYKVTFYFTICLDSCFCYARDGSSIIQWRVGDPIWNSACCQSLSPLLVSANHTLTSISQWRAGNWVLNFFCCILMCLCLCHWRSCKNINQSWNKPFNKSLVVLFSLHHLWHWFVSQQISILLFFQSSNSRHSTLKATINVLGRKKYSNSKIICKSSTQTFRQNPLFHMTNY